MDKRNLNWITWGFVAMMVLIIVLMLAGTLRRPPSITLPAVESLPEQSTGVTGGNNGALTIVEVTPETVQTTIETLSRPEAYRRTVTVEQFWGSGSASYETTVTVNGAWTRIDRTMPDGRVRHTIIGEETTYIWYNNEETVFTAPTGEISADNEQTIPTYEDVLALAVKDIAAADYRTVSDVNCIYVETGELAGGYVIRYWVNVNTGLLVAAEKLLEGETVYRMGALTVDQTVPESQLFMLPDGTALL